MFSVFIVEDDQTITELIREKLSQWQLKTYEVTDFNEVFKQFLTIKPQLVLLDINLPVYDGFYWAQKIRRVSQVPIIFISSRNTNMDKVMAMNMGGDDYMTKPFSLEVLTAKVNALLRRTYNYANPTGNTLAHGGLVLNLQDGSVQVKEQQIELSKTEYKLLQLLLQHHGQIVSREKLLRGLWHDERFVDDNTLTVNINRLRKKIAATGLKHYIETKTGQDYMIP